MLMNFFKDLLDTNKEILKENASIFNGLMKVGALSSNLKNLAILYISRQNKSEICFESHCPVAKEDGISDKKIEALNNFHDASDLFDEKEKSILNYIDEYMENETFINKAYSDLKEKLSEAEILELQSIILAYSSVNRMIDIIS